MKNQTGEFRDLADTGRFERIVMGFKENNGTVPPDGGHRILGSYSEVSILSYIESLKSNNINNRFAVKIHDNIPADTMTLLSFVLRFSHHKYYANSTEQEKIKIQTDAKNYCTTLLSKGAELFYNFDKFYTSDIAIANEINLDLLSLQRKLISDVHAKQTIDKSAKQENLSKKITDKQAAIDNIEKQLLNLREEKKNFEQEFNNHNTVCIENNIKNKRDNLKIAVDDLALIFHNISRFRDEVALLKTKNSEIETKQKRLKEDIQISSQKIESYDNQIKSYLDSKNESNLTRSIIQINEKVQQANIDQIKISSKGEQTKLITLKDEYNNNEKEILNSSKLIKNFEDKILATVKLSDVKIKEYYKVKGELNEEVSKLKKPTVTEQIKVAYDHCKTSDIKDFQQFMDSHLHVAFKDETAAQIFYETKKNVGYLYNFNFTPILLLMRYGATVTKQDHSNNNCLHHMTDSKSIFLNTESWAAEMMASLEPKMLQSKDSYLNTPMERAAKDIHGKDKILHIWQEIATRATKIDYGLSH